MIKRVLAGLFIILSTSLWAQKGDLKGFVYDKENGEAVLFTNVYLVGTSYGASTDINGFFYLDNIPVGNYTLEVSFLGYAKYQKKIKILANRTVKLDVYLEKSAQRLKDVVVSAKRQEAKTEVKMSVVKLSPKQIVALPSMGSDPDLAQAIQTLPGVVFTGDQGGQLYIRGGSPVQNKVLLDGMTLYQPFHSIGFFSVFETDVISNADIYTGGFNAEYGGRISSIMNISLRDGNKQKIKGKVSANTFGANLLLEGPLIKKTEHSSSSLTYLMYGKTSYMKQSSPKIYPYVNDGDGLPFSYNDLYGKMTYSTSGGSKVSVFGFNFTDEVLFKKANKYRWDQWGLGTKIVVVPDNVPAVIAFRASFSNYKIGINGNRNRSSEINGFDFGLNFKFFIGKSELDYGVELVGGKTNFVFQNVTGTTLYQNDNTTEIGFYIKPKFTLGTLILEPGLRLHNFTSLNTFSLEPRLGAKWNVLENFRLKFAGGVYAQNIIAATSDRDVVNLFYGYLSSPENTPKKFKGNEIPNKLQRAKHLILGAEFDLAKGLDLNVEGYYKYFDQLTNINRNKIYDDNDANRNEPDSLKKDYILEEGAAYGVDFTLNYKREALALWLVYSHGYVNRDDGKIEYRTHFDRRHNVNLMGTYAFGKDHSWEFGVRWNYGSGFPFTPVKGFYEMEVLNNNINQNVASNNGQIETVYGDLNSFLLSDYHRLDLSIKKTIDFKKKGNLTANFTITNVYNRKNIFYVDTFDFEKVYQLPVLPSLGLVYKF